MEREACFFMELMLVRSITLRSLREECRVRVARSFVSRAGIPALHAHVLTGSLQSE